MPLGEYEYVKDIFNNTLRRRRRVHRTHTYTQLYYTHGTAGLLLLQLRSVYRVPVSLCVYQRLTWQQKTQATLYTHTHNNFIKQNVFLFLWFLLFINQMEFTNVYNVNVVYSHPTHTHTFHPHISVCTFGKKKIILFPAISLKI